MQKEKKEDGLALAGFVVLFGLLIWAIVGQTNRTVVEIRNEHLIFSSDNCRVYQVVIRNDHGTKVIYISTPDSNGRQTAFPSCRVTK